MNHKILLSSVFLALAAAPSLAQDVLWSKTLGGPGFDGAYAAVEAHGGDGFVLGGIYSPLAYGTSDLQVLRTDAAGDVLWSVTRGAPWDDAVRAVDRTRDGGYIAAGWWKPTVSTHDIYLLRLDGEGKILWEYTYDLGPDDRAHAVVQTSDGGFVVAGQRWFSDITFGSYDIVLMKTDAQGTPLWVRNFAHDTYGADVALTLRETSDGGLVLGGTTQSSVWAGYVIRTDGAGLALWQRTYIDTWSIQSLRELEGGGFVMTGEGRHPSGAAQALLLRTDAEGAPLWQRFFGNPSSDHAGNDVAVLPCGGFVITGQNTLASSWSVYVVRTDEAGTALWSKTLGGAGDDRGFAAVPTSRGTVLVAGWTWSFGAGQGDVWLVDLEDGCPDFTAFCSGDGSGAPCPCGNVGARGRGCANSASAAGALLSASGSPSLGAADLALRGAGLVPGQFGLYFQGESAVAGGAGAPFGDGLRCAGGAVIRLQTVIADTAGSSTTSVDVAALGAVTPGDLRRYQLWYRDATGSLCGAGFNLTNGLELTWAP